MLYALESPAMWHWEMVPRLIFIGQFKWAIMVIQGHPYWRQQKLRTITGCPNT